MRSSGYVRLVPHRRLKTNLLSLDGPFTFHDVITYIVNDKRATSNWEEIAIIRRRGLQTLLDQPEPDCSPYKDKQPRE